MVWDSIILFNRCWCLCFVALVVFCFVLFVWGVCYFGFPGFGMLVCGFALILAPCFTIGRLRDTPCVPFTWMSFCLNFLCLVGFGFLKY